MPAEGLTSHEVFITCITVILDRLNRGLGDAWLLCALRLPDHLATFVTSHFSTSAVLFDITQAFEELKLFAEALPFHSSALCSFDRFLLRWLIVLFACFVHLVARLFILYRLFLACICLG